MRLSVTRGCDREREIGHPGPAQLAEDAALVAFRFRLDVAAGSAGQLAGESEAGEHAVVETGDGADLVAGEGNHEQSHRVEHSAAGVSHVWPERRLAVGPGRDDAVSASLLQGDGAEEAGGELASLVFERRHRKLHVLAEERDDRLDVACLEGSGEPLDEFTFGVRVWRRGRFAMSRGGPVRERR
jgi:hypothetical protein